MFSSIIAVFKTAYQVLKEGLKKVFGTDVSDPDATVIVSKGAAVAIAIAALLCAALPFPNLRTWSDTLFRVSYQLWNSQSLPGRTA